MPFSQLYEEMGPGVYFIRTPVGLAAARIHYAHRIGRTFLHFDGVHPIAGRATYPRLVLFHHAEYDTERLSNTDLTYLLDDFSRLRNEVHNSRFPPPDDTAV